MGSRYKMWRNDRGGKWSTRIIWYQGEDPNDIRLEMTDCEREQQVFPQTREEADHLWFQFRQASPPKGQSTPFVRELIDLMSRKYPHLTISRPRKRNLVMPVAKKRKVIGIVGSRRRDSERDLERCLYQFQALYQPGDRIVSGGCPQGGNRFAEVIAKSFGLTITIHYPNWKIGRHAEFERNTQIAEDCDVLIAVVSDDRTGGTEDTVKKVLKRKKRIYLV